MKKFVTILLVCALSLGVCGCALSEPVAISIAVLKGPTGMGAAYLMDRAAAGETSNAYEFTVAGTADMLVSRLVTGELDMAALPTNVVAQLYQKTQGEVLALAVNTLGVLYVLEKGETVQSVADLSGKLLLSAGRGTAADAITQYILEENGVSATVDFATEHAEVAAKAAAGFADLVLLPEPFVTSLLAQDAGFRVALNLTDEWAKLSDAPLAMGAIAVTAKFAEANPDAIAAFLKEYAESVAYANEHPVDAAALIEKAGVMAAAVAEQAIPRANMVCLAGDDMREALEGFYALLFDFNPATIGGEMPDEGFYYR